MKSGIWMEPEAASENSCFYREHPDWAFTVPGREPVRGRSQLVLDSSRREVTDYIFDSIYQILNNAHIKYLKWDISRSITDVCSVADEMTGEDSPGNVPYRYMLGLYDFLKRLMEHYSDLLIEGCSDGSGRFNVGILYCTSQIQCSDNTDAVDRIRAQYGTSFGYPINTVGSYVSAVLNRQTGRVTSMKTREMVAMTGSFGYGLNLNTISDEEKNCVREQINAYHEYWHLTHDGEYYRLINSSEDRKAATWLFVREDRGETPLSMVAPKVHGNPLTLYVRPEGPKLGAMCRDEDIGAVYPGAGPMSAGIPIPPMTGEYQA